MTVAGVAKVGRATGKLIKWTLILATLLIVIVIVVAVFSLGSAANNSAKNGAQVKPAQFAALKIGTSASTVRRMFGKPESTDQTVVAGFSQTCWLYGVLASKGTYQLCFEKGKLTVKNRF